MTPKQIAAGVLELYGGNAERWTKCVFARGPSGMPTIACSAGACSWCVVGAAYRVAREPCDVDRFLVVASKQLRLANFGERGLTGWNDDKERTFGDVEALLQRMAENKKGPGAP